MNARDGTAPAIAAARCLRRFLDEGVGQVLLDVDVGLATSGEPSLNTAEHGVGALRVILPLSSNTSHVFFSAAR